MFDLKPLTVLTNILSCFNMKFDYVCVYAYHLKVMICSTIYPNIKQHTLAGCMLYVVIHSAAL